MTAPANIASDTTRRAAIYRGLDRRNRMVGTLRWLVPAAGTVVLLVLGAQVLVSSLSDRFGIGRISVTPESVTIDAPEYSGVLEDGSSYRVWADAALNRFTTPDLIDLEGAAMVIDRTNGTRLNVNAPRAQLETLNELVLVEGETHAEDSTGTVATFSRSVFDYATQLLTSQGPVEMVYADGTEIDAEGLTFDAITGIWTFSDVTVRLQDLPGVAPAP